MGSVLLYPLLLVPFPFLLFPLFLSLRLNCVGIIILFSFFFFLFSFFFFLSCFFFFLFSFRYSSFFVLSFFLSFFLSFLKIEFVTNKNLQLWLHFLINSSTFLRWKPQISLFWTEFFLIRSSGQRLEKGIQEETQC